jgi:hypothetical protein
MFLISSPYARKGEIWNLYRKYFGKDGDPRILVAQAPSKVMNDTLPQSVVDRAYERDPASAAAEYGAEFRRDIEAFVSMEAVLACVDQGVFERSREYYKVYQAFTDPSGGSSDAFTLAIGFRDLQSKRLIVSAIREHRPPFSPEQVVAEFSQLLKAYGVSKVVGDRYGGEFPRELFGKYGVRYETAAKAKSDCYIDLLSGINSRRIALIDDRRLLSQLIGLERRTARSGRDSIDHAPGQHDDIANAVAGLFTETISKHPNYDLSYRAFQPSFVDEDRPQPITPQPEPSACNDRLRNYYSSLNAVIGVPDQKAPVLWPQPPRNYWPW